MSSKAHPETHGWIRIRSFCALSELPCLNPPIFLFSLSDFTFLYRTFAGEHICFFAVCFFQQCQPWQLQASVLLISPVDKRSNHTAFSARVRALFSGTALILFIPVLLKKWIPMLWFYKFKPSHNLSEDANPCHGVRCSVALPSQSPLSLNTPFLACFITLLPLCPSLYFSLTAGRTPSSVVLFALPYLISHPLLCVITSIYFSTICYLSVSCAV